MKTFLKTCFAQGAVLLLAACSSTRPDALDLGGLGGDLAGPTDLARGGLDLAHGTLPGDGGGDTVPVAGATFMMGCHTPVDTGCDPDESPYHSVTLSAFEIDRNLVTQSDYQACISAVACSAPSAGFDPAGHAAFPVVNVTWAQADGFCQWLGKRLPTEAEWELAARGTDGRIYPWGNGAATCLLANYLGCTGAAAPVGSFSAGASPFGALDMAGNVWEWVHDYYGASYYSTSPSMNPTGPSSGTTRVCRGGSYGNDAVLMRSSNRSSAYNPAVGGTGLGFRCAR